MSYTAKAPAERVLDLSVKLGAKSGHSLLNLPAGQIEQRVASLLAAEFELDATVTIVDDDLPF